MSMNQQPEDREFRPGHQPRELTLAEVDELLPAFVLGALEPEEMLAVDRFVQQHPSLHTRLDNFENALVRLAHAAPQAPPPPRVKAALINRVRRSMADGQPLASDEARSATPTQLPARPSPRPFVPARPTAPPPTPGLGWFGIFWRTFALAGGAAAIAIFAFTTFQLYGNMQRLVTQLQTVQSELAELQAVNELLAQQNVTLRAELDERAAQYAILVNPQESIALASTGAAAPSAKGNFYTRADQAVLILHGLQPLAADQTYQLWWLSPDGTAVLPGELLTVTNSDSTALSIAIPAEHRDFSGIGISIEPAGGRPTPTTVILLGKLDKNSA